MGKKYIIEIPEDKTADFIGSTHLLMPYSMAGHKGHHDTGLPIKPYTEPDLEQVRKEAYEQGYENGFVAGHLKAEKSGQSFYEDGYKRGISDAWEAARKIHRMPDGDILDLFPDCYASVCTAAQAILKYDASEAIAKIKEYEDGKQEIKVGDEVERILDGEVDSKAVFLEEDEGYYHCLFWTGCCFTTLGYPKKQFRKTGRHFSEIDAVLEKMRGERE